MYETSVIAATDSDMFRGSRACDPWPGWPLLSITCWQCGVPRLIRAPQMQQRQQAEERSCLSCTWREMNNEEPDPIVVERLVAGQYDASRANRRERQEAVAILTQRGYGSILIGRMTGMSSRTVLRLRRRIKAEAAAIQAESVAA